MRQNSSSRRGRGRSNGRRGNPNNANRVYDSNGPDVKVRGTAAHIYEKYQSLARDASSSGDRIAAEAYYQHAEHYFRLLMAQQQAEEQRRAEMEARRAPRFNGEGEDMDGEQPETPMPRRRNGGGEEADGEAPRRGRGRPEATAEQAKEEAETRPSADGEEGDGAGRQSRKIMSPAELVQESQRLSEEEAAPRPRRQRTRRPRAAAAPEAASEAPSEETPAGEPEQATV